jgi:two-component system, chemotaxis family, sensor kinase CheA
MIDLITEITHSFENELETSLGSMVNNFQDQVIINGIILSIVILGIIIIFYRNLSVLNKRLNSISHVMSDVASGKADLKTKVEVVSNDEIDEVAKSFNLMTEYLAIQIKKEQELTWTKTNIVDITTCINSSDNLETLGKTLLSKIVPIMESSHVVFYVKEMVEDNKDPIYRLIASYAFKERKHVNNIIRVGEGLIGQAIYEKSPIILTDVPSDYVQISSGLGEATPLNLFVIPISFFYRI